MTCFCEPIRIARRRPRKVQLAARMLHVGWFAAEQDPHKVILLSYSVGRWDLLVIPPETSAAAAARLMKAAADPRNLLTASALARTVLAVPGMSSSNTCPPEIIAAKTSRISSGLP